MTNIVNSNEDKNNAAGVNNSRRDKKRKLILHFDQHNTIQVACTLPGRRITVEEGLNNFLTSVVWGKEVNDQWVWLSNEPNMCRPDNEPNAITYFKYLEKKIVKSPDDRATLKKLTCGFIDNEHGAKFREFFDLYLQSLTYSNHKKLNGVLSSPDTETELDTDTENTITPAYYYTDIDKCTNPHKKFPPNTIPAGDVTDKSLYHLILPEFFDMIRRLQKSKRDFAIVLRTMGIDSQNFLDTIKPMFERKHKDFMDLEPVKINPNIGHIKRNNDDQIELNMDNEKYVGDEAIYQKLNSLEGINAIRDDFAYWQANDYSCYAAKPLWVDLDDERHQHIIFDDNIRLDTFDDCIVNIRLKNSTNFTFESIDFDSYVIFEKTSILQPNLIKLLNPHLKSDSTKNYYFDLIQKSEKVYDQLVANRDKLNIQTKSYDETLGDANKITFDTSSQISEVDLNNNTINGGNNSISTQVDHVHKTVINSTNNTINTSTITTTFTITNTANDGTHTNAETALPSNDKRFRNVKLNRSFSIKLEETEKEIEKQDKTFSTLCILS